MVDIENINHVFDGFIQKMFTPSLMRILGQSNHVIMTFSYFIQEYGHDLDIFNFNWLGLYPFCEYLVATMMYFMPIDKLK
jgi:hypothetical protein